MEIKIKREDSIALTALSNPVSANERETINNLITLLKKIGLTPIPSRFIFQDTTEHFKNSKEKAEELNEFFLNPRIKMIFDVSGGDICNGCIPYINYKIIKHNPKFFAGYSDLTAVINSIYAKTKNQTVLYQIKNLVLDTSGNQLKNFISTFMEGDNSLFDFKYKFIRGNFMEGKVTGGNIRCFLKLAGTPYFPSLKDKILFLESLSGNQERIFTCLNQISQLKDFDKLAGIVLGTFTELEKTIGTGAEKNIPQLMEKIGISLYKKNIPVALTGDIGHSIGSKALIIGKNLQLQNHK